MKRGGFDYASVAPLYNDLVGRGFSPIHAAAIAGNFAHEAGPKGRIDYGINEIKPTVKGSRGGYGAAQWTGPRRVGLEQFAKKNGLNVADRETQMKYFDQERSGAEKGAFNRLQKTGDVNSATKSFMQNYERPRASTANLANRQQHANEILARAQRGDFNTPDSKTQLAKNDAPIPPQRPADLQAGSPAPTQIAKNDASAGSVLNRINPKDPSGPLLPETAKGYFEQRYAQNTPQQPAAAEMQLTQASPTQGAPTPPIRPADLSPAPVQMADAPMPPSRPSSFAAPPAPVRMAQVHQAAPQGGINQMLMEPQGGGGGVEGMAGGMSAPAQMSPEMMSPQMMAGDQGGFGGLGGLFADAFMPEQPQFADAGGDFGGGMDFGGMGGFDIGSLFG
jgi:hypothetical protein